MKMQNIVILCDYQSIYGGNFIASLIALEKKQMMRAFISYMFFHQGPTIENGFIL